MCALQRKQPAENNFVEWQGRESSEEVRARLVGSYGLEAPTLVGLKAMTEAPMLSRVGSDKPACPATEPTGVVVQGL